jgi:hypothetical protein
MIEYEKDNFTLLIFFVFAKGLSAQNKTLGVRGFLKIGYISLPDAANMLHEIEPLSTQRFGNNFIDFGAEGFFRTDKIIVVLDGNFALPDHRSG